MSMESKEATALLDFIIKTEGFKRVKQGTATRAIAKSYEYMFGDHFVLSMKTRVVAAQWTGSFKISFHSRHRGLDIMDVGSFGWFISKSFSFDRAWGHGGTYEDAANKENLENGQKAFDEFLAHIQIKLKAGRENFARIYSQDVGAFEKRFKERHLPMILEWADNDNAVMEAIYPLTQDERFLPSDAKEMFLF